MVEKRQFCELDEAKRIVSPCWALESIVDGRNSEKRKGAFVWETINLNTGKVSRRYYGIKSGEHKTRGLLFNHCPFCGTQIHYTSEDLKKLVA